MNAAERSETADAPGGLLLGGRLLDGRYRIGPRIARGGMASVYQATDLRLDRTVAVKVMHPGLADDEEFAARFVREARAAARLSHPNVVGVYDQGEEEGVVFLVMEHVPGRTLRDLVRAEAPMPPARAMALLEPVLAALAAAHRAGLVHRDVKPENVLIAAERDGYGTLDRRRNGWDAAGHAGRVKVADFGLAKAVSADTQHTATGGVLIGTVSYLAPEVVVDGRADPRADVYAAGIVLFELLTGRKPHEGDSPIQVAYKHVHEDVPAPSAQVPGIPAYVDALVARATARDPRHRPADAGVLLHQLRRVGQALADGVAEDPELTADLTPLLAHPDTGEPSMTAGVVESTADIVADVAQWLAPGSSSSAPAADPAPADRLSTLESPLVANTGDAPARALTPATALAPAPAADGPHRHAARPARRSRWRGPLLFLLALAVATGAGYAAWWLGVARYTLSPGVLGLSEAAAERRLEAEGLQVDWGQAAYSETVPAGRVLATDPEPGSRVLDGGTVTVVLSRGKERYDVPRLRGLTEDRAQEALLAGGLEFGRSREAYSEGVRKGRVIASSPSAGTTLRPDTAVDLVVSLGRRPIEFGDWTGRDADRAEKSLTARGLTVTRTEAHSGTVAEGRVITQSPADGPLFRGQTVRLEVSKGPQLAAVPTDLVASGVDAARASLQASGFAVDVRNSENYLGLGFVFSVDPGEGSLIPVGSTVVLYLI